MSYYTKIKFQCILSSMVTIEIFFAIQKKKKYFWSNIYHSPYQVIITSSGKEIKKVGKIYTCTSSFVSYIYELKKVMIINNYE